MEIGPGVFLGDGAVDFFGELAAGIGVGHDGEAPAPIAIGEEIAAEAFVGAAVTEAGFAVRGFEAKTESPSAHLGSEHLAGHVLRKNFRGFSGVFVLDFDGHAGEVGGSGPEACGSHFRIGVPAAFDGVAVGAIWSGGFGPKIFRKRLLVSAVSHTGGAENEFAHDLREWLSCDVGHERLQNYVTAAGVTPESARDDIDADGIGVGGFCAVENLDDGGKRIARGVTGKTVNSEASAVAKDAADSNFFFFGEGIFGDFPGAELDVDVFIET